MEESSGEKPQLWWDGAGEVVAQAPGTEAQSNCSCLHWALLGGARAVGSR